MENPTDETNAAADDVTSNKASETVETEKPQKEKQPMPLKEKLCLNVSIMAIAFAILHVTGLTSELPTFLVLAIKEQPGATFFVTGVACLIFTWVLSCFTAPKIAVLGRLPLFAFSAFWLNAAWVQMTSEYPSTLKDTSAAWMLIATMLLGFCVSYHDKGNGKEKPTLSARIEIFTWTTILGNVTAAFLTFLIVDGYIGGVRGGIQTKIDSEVRVHERLDYIFGACPLVRSKEYCDALKIVTSAK